MLREGGGNCLKYLKRGWNRKEGRGSKDLKKVGGLETPYELWYETLNASQLLLVSVAF